MKLNYWLLTAVTAAGTIVASAQDANSVTPASSTPAPVTTPTVDAAPPATGTNAPAHHKKRTTHAKKPASSSASGEKAEKTERKDRNVTMKYDPPLQGVVKDAVVNVRGQPNFVGEVVGHLKKGETVTVYETVTVAKREAGQPTKWDRVDVPTNYFVWVDAQFVDAATQAVKAKKLNLRGGPGENYSVVGHLEKGDPVASVKKEHGWIAINPPTNAFAYVAAECLTLQPMAAPVAVAPAPVSTPPPQPTVVQTPVETPAPVAAQPEPTAPAPTAASQTDQEVAALHKVEAPAPAAAPGASAPSTVLPGENPPRIVTREGFVHKAYNIQAPADYELQDIKSGEVIDFLQPTANQNFKIYVNTRITVTGQEVMDTRWPRTPVLQVQSVDLLP